MIRTRASHGRRGLASRPWVTLLVGGAAAAISVTGSESAFIFDRTRVSAGEIWRLWTANVVHIGWLHAAVDIGLLLVLGWVLEPGRRRLLAFSLGALPPSVTLAVYCFDPGMQTYAGLSGLNFGWLVLIALRGWQRAWTDWFWPAVLLLYGAELVQEAWFGHGMVRFSDPRAVVATWAHVGGGVAAAVLALAGSRVAARSAGVWGTLDHVGSHGSGAVQVSAPRGSSRP